MAFLNVFGRVLDVYLSLGLAGVLKLHPDVVYAFQSGLDFIGPLDKNNGSPVAVIVKSQHLELGYRIQPVSIYMTNIQPAGVFINYYKSRAVNGRKVLGSGAGGYTFNKMRLAASQRPAEGDDLPAPQLRAEIPAELYGLAGRIRRDINAVTHGPIIISQESIVNCLVAPDSNSPWSEQLHPCDTGGPASGRRADLMRA